MDKILIVEDEDLLRLSLKEILEQEGFECFEAKDGNTGLEFVHSANPDLILCDVRMPGMDGLELLNEVRNTPNTSQIPFIFLSALIDRTDIRKGMNLGADDYLTKPVNPDELIKSIRTRLNKNLEIRKRLDGLRTTITKSLPHEMRTPLVSIIGYAEILTDLFKADENKQAFEFAEEIYKSGLRLNRLIQNFIMYTKLESLDSEVSSSNIKLNPVNISKNFIEDIAVKKAQEYKREQDLILNIEQTTLSVDLNDFSILLEEIIDNAFKFSYEGSAITLKTSNKENLFEIILQDNGRGMTEQQINSVGALQQFERNVFEQQGAGMGLIISKKIVERYGGKFILESKKGSGITVKIKLLRLK